MKRKLNEERILLRTVKVGDILTVYPYKKRVKVIEVVAEKFILKESDERYYLKDYWKERHGITLPKAFRIVTCKFTTTYKEYDYPLYRKCVKKPLRQKRLKERWESKRKVMINARVSKMKAPSDYTMYQMGF